MASHIYLAKASTDLLCFCECAEALMTFPPQLDCPWCGCGWLFSCSECRTSFTFARGVTVNESWEDLARRDMTNYGRTSVSTDDVDNWVRAMKELLAHVKVGATYVCLDSVIIPVDAGAFQFEGRHSRHDLAFVPQVAALEDRSVIDDLLSSPEYWRERPNALVRRRWRAAECDFGATVVVSRADGQPPHPADEARIRAAARASPFAGLELGVGYRVADDDTEGVALYLTSYFLEEDDNAAEEAAITARDEAVALRFAEQLGRALGGGYCVEAYSGRW